MYTRDSTTWLLLGFEGETVLMHLLRKADRAGVIDLAGCEPWQAPVIHCRVPEHIARVGIAACLEQGVLVHDADRLVFPNFLEAQECAMSDAQRARESRARRAALSRFVPLPVQNVSAPARNVPQPSHAVTDGHSVPCRAVPYRADPDLDPLPPLQISAVRGEQAASQSAPPTPPEFPLSEHARATAAAAWLSKATGQEPFPVTPKWRQSLLDLWAKPEAQKLAAARVLALEAQKPDVAAMLTPDHVNSWFHNKYGVGKAPGPQERASWKDRPPAPPAPKSELQQLQEDYKTLQKAEAACLYDEDGKRADIQRRKAELSARIAKLKPPNGAGHAH